MRVLIIKNHKIYIFLYINIYYIFSSFFYYSITYNKITLYSNNINDNINITIIASFKYNNGILILPLPLGASIKETKKPNAIKEII